MIQNKAVQLLIGATDQQTGAVLEDLPVVVAREFNFTTSGSSVIYAPVGPSSGGFTGSSFDYTPGKTDTTAYVLVSDSPGYTPTQVGPVTVTPPPAPRRQRPLFLSAGARCTGSTSPALNARLRALATVGASSLRGHGPAIS